MSERTRYIISAVIGTVFGIAIGLCIFAGWSAAMDASDAAFAARTGISFRPGSRSTRPAAEITIRINRRKERSWTTN